MNEISRQLRILMLEDSNIDADLVMSFVNKGRKPTPRIERVQTREEFTQALAEPWDLILADFDLPGFDGLTALEMTLVRAPHVPFVFVSGVLGEEFAVDSLRRGAADYVLKRNLSRLPSAIERALTLGRERAERIRAETQMRAARDAAQAANEAKDKFLAILSHELRTPLTPILSTVEAWDRDGAIPQEMRESIALIRRNVELESRLIDDLLDLTRISRGKLQLHRERTDLHTIISHAIQICRPQIDAKSLSLEAQLPAAPCVVHGDGARLQQVFWNIINNAAKFTPTGGKIRIVARELPEKQIEVSITDDGIGISADSLPRIFDAFEQGDGDPGRRLGGLGLGLAIAHAIVLHHGGTLSASSGGAGQGSTFQVVLPVLSEDVPSGPVDRTPAARSPGRGLRVLLVEDHADSSAAMARLLRLTGHDVTVAHTVRDGSAQLGTGSFDVLISDLGLPDGSGHELARLADSSRMLTVAITGFGMDQDIARSKDAGFQQHLIKPVNFDKLVTVIDQFHEAGKEIEPQMNTDERR